MSDLTLGFAPLKKFFLKNLLLAVVHFHCSVFFSSNCGEWGCSLVAMCGGFSCCGAQAVGHVRFGS